MAVHYTKERSKYGTLTGSIIVWPVEVGSASNPNNITNINQLPAGYLRCDGSKYNASDYPLLAEICGTGPTCKFAKFDENDELIGTIGEEEFVVPDLGSKFPSPVSGADAGTFNNILTQTQSGSFIKRSGIGIEATSNLGTVAQVTYNGSFILPSQIVQVKGKPSWEWGNAGRLDPDAVDNNAIHPHMHFSTTSRVRLKAKSAATGGVIEVGGILINVTDASLNSSYNGTAFVGYGSGTTEVGGFASPGFGSGYVAFGGGYSSSLITTRNYTATIDNTAGYSLMAVTSIVGNDSNGGERPNNAGEGIYIIWPDGTKSSSPILPARQESGLQGGQYDSQYASWSTQTLAIPEQFKGTVMTVTFTQSVQEWENELQDPYENPPGTPVAGYANYYDMCGLVQIGLSGAFQEDPNLIDDGNDTPAGITYFKTATTINVEKWLDATKAESPGNSAPGSGQPACWALASGSQAGTTIQSSGINLILPVPPFIVYEIIQRYNFCSTGCSLSQLRCYCLLKDSVTYDLEKDWFGIPGMRSSDYASSGFPQICSTDPFGRGSNVPEFKDGVAPSTYVYGKQGVGVDWKGLPTDDILPFNSVVTEEQVFPQARNVYSVVEELVQEDDPTIHDHKITFERDDHKYYIVTSPTLIDPDNLNTTLQLNPTTVASIDDATVPFIVFEYLIKT